MAITRPPLQHTAEATIAVAAFGVASLPSPDSDYWWHLAVGRHIVQQREWPRPDPFSFTASEEPWTVHEWLLEIVMYLLHSTFGPWGTIAFFAVCFAGSMGIAFAALRAASLSVVRATEIVVLLTLACAS